MHRLALVDLGSNTARLVVYEFSPGEWWRLTDSIREPIRLGAGLVRKGRLTRKAIRRARETLELFSDYAEAASLAPVAVYCTSAVRDAENGHELLAALDDPNLQPRVLSGEEEAELSVLAVANSLSLRDSWVVDLGGGSAQIALMRERSYRSGASYPLGAVRVTEGFLRSDPPSAEEVSALEAFCEETLGAVVSEIRDSGLPLVALGGTIRNLAGAVQEATEYPVPLMHGYSLRRDDLDAVTDRLLELRSSRRASKLPINPDRADIILGGALVFRWLMRAAGLEKLEISGYGMRDGAFYRSFLPPPHLIPDPASFSVRNVAYHYSQRSDHVVRVRRLALRIFDELQQVHGLGEDTRRLLSAAADLHDVGMAVEYHRHHKHGLYLLFSQPLEGFDHREQAMIALVVRYHRKGQPKTGALAPILQEGDEKRLLQLTSCLRIAEQLERARAARVRDLGVEIAGDQAVLWVEATQSPTIELWEASKHAGLFYDAFGLELELRSFEAAQKPGDEQPFELAAAGAKLGPGSDE